MNIGIIGGGSIGLLVSSYLARKHDITLYVNRDIQQKQLHTYKLHLEKGKNVDKKQIQTALLRYLHDADCIIICVKQPHLKKIMPSLMKLKSQIPLIFLQNGMGHLEQIKSLPHPVYVGVVTHGAHRINDYTVRHLGNGEITLASYSGTQRQLDELIDTLHTANFIVNQTSDWGALLKNKLIVNAVINPLTAIFDVANGEIIRNPHINTLAKEICTETASVLELDPDESWARVIQTAQKTSKNTSSMRSDIHHKRETELEAITGYVMRQSNDKLPYTTFAYHAVCAHLTKKGNNR